MCGYDLYYGNAETQKMVKDVLAKSSDNMILRGPDQSSKLQSVIAQKNSLLVRHFRLNIIGETNGKQPKKNKDYILLYNGEIFNFVNLGNKYFKKSYLSDTEFLFDVLTYEKYHIVSEFDGFFSFTFINQNTGEILCGRDRFGIKPLQKVELDTGFYLTTDIKLAYHVAKIKTVKIEQNTVKEFFIFGNPLYNNKYLKNIHEIEPGKITRFINNQTYNVLDFNGATEFDQLKYLNSIKLWRYPNEEVQFSLSGGVDSNTIYSILRHQNDTSLFLNYNCDDENFQSELNCVRLNDNKVHEINKTKNDLDLEIYKIMDAYFEPYSGGIPSFWVYEQARKNGFKVCYTGVGGDELFGGYGINSVKCKSLVKLFLTGRLSELRLLLRRNTRNYFNLLELNHSEKISLLNGYNPKENINLDVVLSALLKNQFLNACDRFGMYHGVEVRPPLLNVNAPKILYSKDQEKKILRNLTSGQHFVSDKKVGFTIRTSDMIASDFVKSCRDDAIKFAQDLLSLKIENPSDMLLLRLSAVYNFYLRITT
tara:strand:- start:2568 stop:4178 length:1611 start_codon:yes stop_codon:yes gene_type:complete